jgi:hypothetical protein
VAADARQRPVARRGRGRDTGLRLDRVATLLLLDGWLREQGGGNPFAVAIVDAGAAAISMAAGLASALFAVSAYRRLAR